MTEALLLVWALAVAAFDLRQRRLPNVLTLGGVAAGIAILLISGKTLLGSAPSPAWQGLGLALLLTLPAYPLHLLGAGDVKLAAAIGILTGLYPFIIIYALAALLCMALLLALRCCQFLPYLQLRCPAFLTTAFSGPGRTLPFGAALGIGLAVVVLGRLGGYPI